MTLDPKSVKAVSLLLKVVESQERVIFLANQWHMTRSVEDRVELTRALDELSVRRRAAGLSAEPL